MRNVKYYSANIYPDVPEHVLDAAVAIDNWTRMNGWKDWVIYGVASRSLVERLEEKIDDAIRVLE